MTEYMLAVHHDVDQPAPEMTPEEMQELFGIVDAFNAEMQGAGIWVFGGGLQPPDTATTVKAGTGDTLITDGPFAETKEHLGGFWIIEVPDLDVALSWAERASVACRETIEVRPFQEG